MHLLADINTKKLWNIPEEKYSGQLEILNSSIKSFVNSYVGIALTFNIFYLSIISIFLKWHHFLLYWLVYLNQQEEVIIHQHLIYLLYFPYCVN